jgi:hypothetical protein
MRFLTLLLILVSIKNLIGDDNLKNTLSPNGKIGINGSYGDLFLVDVATGNKLSPLFPPEQQGQISNVAIEVKWASDSRAVAIKASYGTRLNEILLFSFDGEAAKLLKFSAPDLTQIFGAKLGDENAVGYDENVLGSWNNINTVDVVYGMAKVFGNETRHFLVPAKLTIVDGKAAIKCGDPKIFSDTEYDSYMQSRHLQ